MLVIVVDTLRADELGIMGYARETTPEIDRWAETAWVYERTYSSAPWTLPAIATLLTGAWPARHQAGRVYLEGRNVWEFTGLNPELPTLAEILTSNGWSSAAIVNNRLLDSEFGLSRGFQTWDFHSSSIHWTRTADRTTDRALEWLAKLGDKRYFLLVHFFDPHLSYRAPPPFWDRWGGAEVAELADWRIQKYRRRLRSGQGLPIHSLRAAYDEEVRFTDAQVGRLLHGLEELGLASRTAVLLTADHGEEFLDHGGFEHGHTLFDELLHVPLILDVPGEPAMRVQRAVSLVDVAPTVLEILGLPITESFVGISLLHPAAAPERRLLRAGEVLYGRPARSVLRWPWKLIRRGESVRVYRLDQDPGETENLAPRRPDIVASLEDALSLPNCSPLEERPAVKLDEDARRDLRSLGYLE